MSVISMKQLLEAASISDITPEDGILRWRNTSSQKETEYTHRPSENSKEARRGVYVYP